MTRVLLALAAAIVVAADSPSPARGTGKIPVLLVTGANNHDWEWSSAEIERILEESGLFDVAVTTAPSEALADAAAIARFRAFVLDYNGPRWGEPAKTNFLDAVRGGAGVAVIHAANNAFPGWTEYETLAGLCWREGTGHGKFHAFDVAITDRAHPVTRFLPDLRAHPDELYHRLKHMHEAPIRVLATARSSLESGGTGEDEPMLIVQAFGLGRVFHTPLGHVWKGVPETRASLADSQLRNLVVRGVEWAATGEVTDGSAAPNALTAIERASGYRLLLDGLSPASLRGTNFETVDGCLRSVPGASVGGDLVLADGVRDFDLEFEWKAASGANGGLKYRASRKPDETTGAPRLFGFEYQVLEGSAAQDSTSTASLYGLVPAEGARPRPTGAFNASRVVVSGGRAFHFLNGDKVVDEALEGGDFARRLAASPFASDPSFGGPDRALIGIQDHGGEVWFRSMKLRDRARLPGRPVSLFDGRSLAGWVSRGDARFAADSGTILGETGGGAQSFLVTDRAFGDFLLEMDVRTEGPGNSGVQVRSRAEPGRPLVGYQVEIDPSERAWSGGLYDEGRRGWLEDLSANEAGRRAFRPGEWNRYRIECVGPSIRAFVNEVETANVLDPLDLEGVIGLQVHSGQGTRVRFRNLALRDLGRRNYEPVPPSLFRLEAGGPFAGSLEGAARAVSQETRGDATLRVRFRASQGSALRLSIRTDPAAAAGDAPALALAPGVSSSRAGVVLEPAAFAAPSRDGESNELAVMAYGARVAVNWNGRTVADVAARGAPLAGLVVLESTGPADGRVEIESIESLTESAP